MAAADNSSKAYKEAHRQQTIIEAEKDMQLFEEMDHLPSQYFDKLVNSDDIFEIKAQLGSDIFRIFGFFENDTTFIATHGLRKKTPKTPRSEIVLAENRKLAYIKAKEHKHE